MRTQKIQIPKRFPASICETVIKLFLEKYKGNYSHPVVQVLNDNNEIVLELEVDEDQLWRVKSSTIDFEVIENTIL